MSLFSVSKLRAESLLLSLIDVYDLCLLSMFTTTVTTKPVSISFCPLNNLCLWNRKHEIGKTKSEANLSYFPKGGFGERSSVTAPNRFKLAKQQLCTCIAFYTFLCHFCATTTWNYLILVYLWQLAKPNAKMESSVCAAKSRLFGGGAWNRVFSPGQMRRLFEGGGRLEGGDAYSSKYDN